MTDPRVAQMVTALADHVLDYGADASRLLLRILRGLAKGHPVTREQVSQISAELGMDRLEAEGFLLDKTERDKEEAIVGIAGLSLNKHPHRFIVDGVRLSTWCAEDALFLPHLLEKEARVVSRSPVSGEIVRLRVGPDGVKEVAPSGAVISLALVDPEQENMSSVQAIWNAFCRHIHFFATREEAEVWVNGREGIAIVTVEEGFSVGSQLWSKTLRYVA